MSLSDAIKIFRNDNPTISKKDFLKMMGDAFSLLDNDKSSKKKKEVDPNKPPRELSEYQKFIQKTSKEVKSDGTKYKMAEIAELWKEFKASNSQKTTPPKKTTPPEKEEEEEPEEEEEEEEPEEKEEESKVKSARGGFRGAEKKSETPKARK